MSLLGFCVGTSPSLNRPAQAVRCVQDLRCCKQTAFVHSPFLAKKCTLPRAVSPVSRPKCSVGSNDSEGVHDGLVLDRRDIDAGGGVFRGRTARFRQRSTLGELDIMEVPALTDVEQQEEHAREVDVELVVQPLRDDFRVMGRVSTVVSRECDRCCAVFDEEVDGGDFEVWLRCVDEEVSGVEERTLEAVEEFFGPRARVDLTPHARDAVLLALPSRAICGSSCQNSAPIRVGGVLNDAGRIGSLDGAPTSENDSKSINARAAIDATQEVSPAGMDALLDLKRKLEGRA